LGEVAHRLEIYHPALQSRHYRIAAKTIEAWGGKMDTQCIQVSGDHISMCRHRVPVAAGTRAVQCILSALLFLGCGLATAHAQDAAYFRNQTIRIVIPSAPGGGRVLNTLPFIQFYGRHLPGNPLVQPVFMPGAGGSQAVNYTYNVAPRDGLTLVTPLVDVPSAQAIGDSAVKYDVSKMSWIGRTTDAVRVLFVRSDTQVRDIDGLRARELIIGSAGRSTQTYSNPAIMNKVLGTRFKIVIGYKSAVDVNQAVELRETDSATTSWANLNSLHPDWIRDGKMRVLFQIGLAKVPDLENVPLLVDAASDEQSRAVIRFMSAASDIGEGFLAPPGVPDAVVTMLRRGFDETMRDPEYQAAVKKLNITLNALTGEEMTKISAGIVGAPKSVIDLYMAAIGE
jgi:tripartite-type tricarboxylate transporter receptor subunit TctC